MALAIDASTPSVATNSTVAQSDTATTASFTPPANSLLVIGISADNQGASAANTITVTDNLGTHLTYTLRVASTASDSPATGGYSALYTAPVVTSAAMTVSVTNAVTSGDAALAVQVYVLTGGGTTPTVGANGKTASNTAGTSIAQAFTATGTSSWGFSAVCDWSATGTMTGGTGNTVTSSATFTGLFSYGFVRRTTADGVNGSATTITANLGASSSAKHIAAVEVLDPGGAAVEIPLLVMART